MKTLEPGVALATIAPIQIGRGSRPQVALGAGGMTAVTWSGYETDYSVWANRYAGGKWGSPQRLADGIPNRRNRPPELTVDRAGNVLVVWDQAEGTQETDGFSVRTSAYRAATGAWKPAEVLAQSAGVPQLAADSLGRATVVWHQSDGKKFSIWARRYDARSDRWNAAALLEHDDTGHAMLPRVATDGEGNVLVVWAQSDGTPLSRPMGGQRLPGNRD